ncbi:hypothetical protein A5886_001500 [Enterococcus sp. 8G7_MSG3316]|uniref:HTH cro/C1-type domain-containing protein n=1 Tax=Candidatus Enterococcus testudinis TaxID=1834191 RepID=A0A242A734_9ENTE|nr:helix-turn-helix transcriptional regulator [Enterococcus sp. 8G7_MSG3316]OTN76423.1 hypothetical protein A5886_001500 [Enterococcus sp. 8G7_MSG3316]
MSFGENLKKFREEKQLGVNQLALKSGVSAAQISRFENGKRKTAHIETAKKLADALSVPLALLIGEPVYYSSDELNEKQQKIVSMVDESMSEEEVADILDYIDFIKLKRKKSQK